MQNRRSTWYSAARPRRWRQDVAPKILRTASTRSSPIRPAGLGLAVCVRRGTVAQYARTISVPSCDTESASGRLAQRERRCLTRTRSQVRILYRPPQPLESHRKVAFVVVWGGTTALDASERGPCEAGRFELGQVHSRGMLVSPRERRVSRLFAGSGALPLTEKTP